MSQLKKLVIWNSDATTKSNLFEQVTNTLMQQDLASDPIQLMVALKQRERAGSTMIDPLLAAPHAQTNSLKQNVMILVRTQVPIEQWDETNDAQNFIFCLMRNDIDQASAHELTQILKQAVAEGMQTTFRQANKTQILKKLNFTE